LLSLLYIVPQIIGSFALLAEFFRVQPSKQPQCSKVFTEMCHCDSCDSSGFGSMESYSSADFSADLALIPDGPTQRVVHYLQQSTAANHGALVAMLHDIKVDTAYSAGSAHAFISSSGVAQQHPPAPFPVHIIASELPEFSASDDISSTTSGASGNSHADGRWLQCPFCPHRHSNEKSHVQHLHRVMLRTSIHYTGHCVMAESHVALKSFSGTHVDKCTQFISKYCSMLHSRSKSAVDDERACKLQVWLADISRE
jgi:hypothetical protein